MVKGEYSLGKLPSGQSINFAKLKRKAAFNSYSLAAAIEPAKALGKWTLQKKKEVANAEQTNRARKFFAALRHADSDSVPR